jgi:2',3'-cyclic-nucleotide 2'-phosphodiesterase (5'-nucleotidase family)
MRKRTVSLHATAIFEEMVSISQVSIIYYISKLSSEITVVGPITLGDLMTILPYLDPTVVVELDANSLWDALESALSRWPTQEG